MTLRDGCRAIAAATKVVIARRPSGRRGNPVFLVYFDAAPPLKGGGTVVKITMP